MGYTRVNYRDVDAVGGGLHFLRGPLECERLGVTVIECDPGWTGKLHDHASDDHEEVYLLVEGEATVVVDGERVSLTAGDAIRISPEATRRIHNGDTESTFVLAGAP
ncbi:cupin domain-containing protein [Halobaculum marinum]|uniref:Cupin domain-containing protein n=1 Tax=Halobaculum marinum TaxID=3031996 RepID=A0ABD5WXL6_9EURY|nr:cupin domain-containing protein [Halobaculum sp. DT55]